MGVKGKPSPETPSPRVGRDELNLCEFPIGLLSDRPSKKIPTSLRFESGQKVWEVSGHPRHGLPTAGDIEVYVCLMELTREQNYPHKVQFTRHDLLRRLGWGVGAGKYHRLQLAFNRLVGVTIQTVNAYYDAKDRQWLRQHAFHILEEYELTDHRHAVSEDEPASWFRWGEAMWRNLQAGYIKSLDVALFLTLESSISQALYRYLDAKIRDGKTLFRQNLKDLAYQHLGLSRDYWPSDIKRKLAPAHAELIAVGFLASAAYARTLQGEEMVVYQFPRRRGRGMIDGGSGATAPELSLLSDNPKSKRRVPTEWVSGTRNLNSDASLAPALVEQGIAGETARHLVESWPERCRQQLDWLPYRDDLQNPGGALRRAIEEDWAPPPRWLEAQARRERDAAQQQRRQQAAEQEAQAAAQHAAFDAWWSSLPTAEQAALTAEAKAELFADSPTIAQHYQRHPERLQEALRPLLLRRMP
jgi:hypothetical protein